MPSDRLIMTCPSRPMTGVARFDARQPVLTDAAIFGALLLDAYHGTVDFEGEDLPQSIEAAHSFLSGEDFPLIPDASFAVMEAGRMKAISFVGEFEGQPLLIVTATEKASQRLGLASELINRSLKALERQEKPALRLFVTATNTPAIKAYEKLGFTPEH